MHGVMTQDTRAIVFLAPVTASGFSRVQFTIIVFMWLKRQDILTGLGELSMCVAVPAEVLEIKDGNIGLVDYGELKQEVRLDLVDVKVGEFVLVHVGFAIQKLTREEGLETRQIFKEVYAALEE